MSEKRRIIDVYGFADYLDEQCSDLYIQELIEADENLKHYWEGFRNAFNYIFNIITSNNKIELCNRYKEFKDFPYWLENTDVHYISELNDKSSEEYVSLDELKKEENDLNNKYIDAECLLNWLIDEYAVNIDMINDNKNFSYEELKNNKNITKKEIKAIKCNNDYIKVLETENGFIERLISIICGSGEHLYDDEIVYWLKQKDEVISNEM